jgi:hypothetical protein
MTIIRGTTSSKAKRRVYGSLLALLLFVAPLPAFADTLGVSVGTDATTSNTESTGQPTPGQTSQTPDPNPPAPQPTPAPSPSSGDGNPVVAAASVSLPDNQPTQPTLTTSSNTQTNIQNQVDSSSISGNADVSHNYTAGNATSGQASAAATVVNVANSTTNFGNLGTGNNFTSFTQDVYGDWQQNILVDPATLLQAPANGQTTTTTGGGVQRTVSLTDILNNITLAAKSGDATVNDNYTAGNATSGDASALANIINIVGSSLNAQQSFLGVINIYGNLKGDILVPSSFVDSLFKGNASGQPTGGSASNALDFTSAANSSNSTNTTIDNNITANAASGNATVSDNHTGGNATTGDAKTNITVFNLTGQTVVAKNSLLVFVNVLGKWVGMIVPAQGSTAAALIGGGGSNANQNTSNAVQSGNSSTDTTTHITNNVSVNANTGDATVSDNYTGGNATSGNAAAGVNLLNITDSNFALGDWFGALFINVLGTWLGDFGIQPPATPATGTADGGTDQPIQDVKVYQFQNDTPVIIASSNSSSSTGRHGRGGGAAISQDTGSNLPTPHAGSVLGDSSSNDQQGSDHATANFKFDLVALIAMIGALTLLFALASLAVRYGLMRRRLLNTN